MHRRLTRICYRIFLRSAKRRKSRKLGRIRFNEKRGCRGVSPRNNRHDEPSFERRHQRQSSRSRPARSCEKFLFIESLSDTRASLSTQALHAINLGNTESS